MWREGTERLAGIYEVNVPMATNVLHVIIEENHFPLERMVENDVRSDQRVSQVNPIPSSQRIFKDYILSPEAFYLEAPSVN